MSIERVQITVSTTGGSGSATGSNAAAVPRGRLVAVYLDYHASAPGTTDVTFTATGDPASRLLLTVTNSNTDAWVFPGDQMDSESAAAVTGAYQSSLLHGFGLTIALAGSDPLTGALVADAFIEV